MRLPVAVLALTLPLAVGMDSMASEQSQRVLGDVAVAANAASGELPQQKNNPLDAAFETFALSKLEEWHVPGLAIAVVDGDETWSAGYGYASFPSKPVTPSTLFYAGSTTKAFTAALLSLLIDDKEAYPALAEKGWRTPIASLIRDDFVLTPENAWAQEHLTLEDALSHRTGFPRHDKSLAFRYGDTTAAAAAPPRPPPPPAASGGERQDREATVADFTRSLRHLPAIAEPRVVFRYCNLMYMVASHAIQTVAGGGRRRLGDLLHERIWSPLGMNSTYFSLAAARAAPEDLAGGYYWDYEGEEEEKKKNNRNSSSSSSTGGGGGFKEVPPMGLADDDGAGSTISTVADYARWIRCLVDAGAPLSEAGHRAVTTPRTANARPGHGYDGPSSYALGWYADTYRGHRVLSHSGGMEAYGAEVFFLPGLRYGVVVFGNTPLTCNLAARELIWKLINDRLGVPDGERFDWNAWLKKSLEDIYKGFEKPEEKLYPNRPDPPLPRALPLEAYTGTYFHPAYRNITIELSHVEGQLHARRTDFVWQMTFDFVHVSGEYWFIMIDMLNAPNKLSGQLAKAQFRLGLSGKVEELLIEFLESGTEGVITFQRLA